MHLNYLQDKRGEVMICMVMKQFIVNNATNGFDIHCLNTGMYIHILDTGKPIRHVLKQVAFVEESKIIVTGSDHSAVYIFDDNRHKSQVLQHSE